MHERGKSDSSTARHRGRNQSGAARNLRFARTAQVRPRNAIVPGKPSNNGKLRGKGGQGEFYLGTKLETAETAKSEPTASATASGALAEEVEGRELAKGNSVGRRRVRTQRRAALKQATDRIREAVRRERRERRGQLTDHMDSP